MLPSPWRGVIAQAGTIAQLALAARSAGPPLTHSMAGQCRRRKSVEGLSIDFTYLNPLGFACVTAFNAALFASPAVRDQYRLRHNGHAPSVHLNDLVFALHALLISGLTLLQSLVYRVSRLSFYRTERCLPLPLPVSA